MTRNCTYRWICAFAVYCLCALGVANFVIAEEDAAKKTIDLAKVFAPREVEVEVLDAKPPEDIARISKKFNDAAQANREWFLQYVKSEAKDGQPLPYHPNFGITEEEYMRFGKALKNLKFEPVGNGRLRFVALQDSKLQIENVKGLKQFDHVIVDAVRKQVDTPWGAISLNKAIHTDEKSALGVWDGRGGTAQSGDANSDSVTYLLCDVGLQAKSGLNLMRLRVGVAKKGLKTTDFETVIRFP